MEKIDSRLISRVGEAFRYYLEKEGYPVEFAHCALTAIDRWRLGEELHETKTAFKRYHEEVEKAKKEAQGVCGHADCQERIDHVLANPCGGCKIYFCEKHLSAAVREERVVKLCSECAD